MIHLICDTTACLTRQEAKELGVLMVPMHFTRGDLKTFPEGYVEDWTPTPGESLLHYTTAQASAAAFADLFEKLKRQGHQALCITISSRLSGTYANALHAANEAGPHVQVVDSRSTGAAMYLLLKEARRQIDAGAELMSVFESLKELRDHTRTLFSLRDMAPLRKSGRLGFVRMSVSTLLNVRPLLTLEDGSVVSYAQSRGRQDEHRKLADGITGNPTDVVVQYCGDREQAEALSGLLTARGYHVTLRRIGIVLAVHLGVPVLSTAWVQNT